MSLPKNEKVTVEVVAPLTTTQVQHVAPQPIPNIFTCIAQVQQVAPK